MQISRWFRAQLGLVLLGVTLIPTRGQAHGDAASIVAQMGLLLISENKEFILERSRRMAAFGPWLGGSAATDTRNGYVDGHVTYGLGFFLFKDPLLDFSGIKERISEIAQEKLLTKLKELRRDGEARLSTAERTQLQQEIRAAVMDHFRALKEGRPPFWPKAMFAATAEGGVPLRHGRGRQARFMLGAGISHFYFGPTIAFEFGDDYSALLGPELGTSFLPGAGPRSPVINLFVRYEARLMSYTRHNPITFGVRILLDVI